MRTRALLLLLLCLLLHAVASWHRYALDEWLHGVDASLAVFVWVWLREVSLAALTAALVAVALTFRSTRHA